MHKGGTTSYGGEKKNCFDDFNNKDTSNQMPSQGQGPVQGFNNFGGSGSEGFGSTPMPMDEKENKGRFHKVFGNLGNFDAEEAVERLKEEGSKYFPNK
jgi:hypothetical protein